jgi:hypothetical protein
VSDPLERPDLQGFGTELAHFGLDGSRTLKRHSRQGFVNPRRLNLYSSLNSAVAGICDAGLILLDAQASMSATSFLRLSEPRQVLVRLCQTVNFGQIHDLSVRDCEPVSKCPAPTVFADIRLDAEERLRGEILISDFALSAEVTRLIAVLDRIQNGKISKLEVRAGLPRRLTLEDRPAMADRAS